MNAIQLLIQEHNKVRTTLKEIVGSSDFDKKKELFKSLRYDLIRHEKMEQTVWYPHFQNSDKLDDTVKHLIKEEKEAHQEIQDISHTFSDDEWESKFKKFKDDVEHHASEEEDKLFPQVKKILSDEELEKIGKEMMAFEHQYDANKKS
jgi:hemerythrin superfamily protein